MGSTKGQALNGEAIQAKIQSLQNEVSAVSAGLTGIRPPDPEREQHMVDLAQKIGTIRGRPLHYRYVGTGAGRGAYVELEDGSVKMDLINGIGINILGHGHPRVMAAAIRGASQDVVMQGNLEPNKEYAEFSTRILEIAARGSRLKHVWLSTCGTMANENAVKACRQKRDKARIVIAMEHAFAGRSTMMAEITDNPNFKQGLPDYNEVVRIPWYDKSDPQTIDKTLRALKEHVAKHDKNVCCFSFEPIQGEGGFNVAPKEFFLPLLEFCREKQIPVWFDEVQTFMRTGQFFAFQTMGLGEYVDVCTIAKTAQNGATFFTAELNPKPGLIAGTFSGSTAALTAGIEIMNILDKDGYMGAGGKIEKIHREFVGMLNRLGETTCKGHLRDAGGMGLMVAVTPYDGSKAKTDQVLQALFKNGIIAFSCGHGPYRIRFLLPAVLTTEDIAAAEKVIEKTILENV